jgi:hypothetical protein
MMHSYSGWFPDAEIISFQTKKLQQAKKGCHKQHIQ